MSVTSKKEGFTYFVEVTIQAGRMEEFLQLYEPMLRQITQEDGFQSIEVFKSDENPNHLCWVENWSISPSQFNEVCLTYDNT
jgi:quinol monooxygenase YgiN